jgi:hypothetical protein
MSHATKQARMLVAGRAPLARMPALIILVYAAAVYLLFLVVLGYAAGFFAGFGVPKGIDQGPRAAVPVAVAIDLLLLQHPAVHRARPVQPHPASPDGRVPGRLLVGAHDDGWALAVRGHRDRLHPGRHRIRGT